MRFFLLMTPDGKLTVDLDACAICKPDGYGQAEGIVNSWTQTVQATTRITGGGT